MNGKEASLRKRRGIINGIKDLVSMDHGDDLLLLELE